MLVLEVLFGLSQNPPNLEKPGWRSDEFGFDSDPMHMWAQGGQTNCLCAVHIYSFYSKCVGFTEHFAELPKITKI